MLSRSYESDDTTPSDKHNIKNVLREALINQLQRIRKSLKPTFIFDVGTRASAALLRKFASNLRQCSDDVLKARSNSNRSSNEVMKDSVPAQIFRYVQSEVKKWSNRLEAVVSQN